MPTAALLSEPVLGVRAPYLVGEAPPGLAGDPEHRAGPVVGVADGDQVLVLADFDALATVSTGVT
jgi:hypothetical protein